MESVILLLPELISRAIIYSLFAISFVYFYYSYGFFNFSIPALVSFGVYLLNFLIVNHYNPVFSIVLVFSMIIFINKTIDWAVFYHFTKISTPNLNLMIVSLGVYAIIMGLTSILWGNMPIKNDLLSNRLISHQLGTIHFCVGLILLLTYMIILNTKLGLMFRAIQSDKTLVQIYGIKIAPFLTIFGGLSITYALSSGIIRSIDYSYIPTSSFNLYITGGVAMIIGGVKSKYGFILASFFISILQSIIILNINAAWSDAIVYVVLIIVLIFRPLGFSGKRLKKIEI